uniref:Uncharacterized protein n=1 Tax=Arundo donax TaxID=35708 RepID=A0A0A9GCV4_ARUDO
MLLQLQQWCQNLVWNLTMKIEHTSSTIGMLDMWALVFVRVHQTNQLKTSQGQEPLYAREKVFVRTRKELKKLKGHDQKQE